MRIAPPVVREHSGVWVVRDDLIPGGTKTRYLHSVFEKADEVVYATPAWGGAQLALAYCARALGKRATIFVAKRAQPHARTREARAAGARVFQVPHGYLSNVQAKAKAYAQAAGAYLLPWGGDLPGCIAAIAAAAAAVREREGDFDQVWCAAGSGVLTRGLQDGFGPGPAYFAVQVGADVRKAGNAKVLPSGLPFEREAPKQPPFPSCPNYDAKAWALCQRHGKGRVLFWNVAAPSPTPIAQALGLFVPP